MIKSRDEKVQTDADAVQPITADGLVNEEFNQLYGKDKNPYVGTEHDRGDRGCPGAISLGGSKEFWNKIKIDGTETDKGANGSSDKEGN